MTILGAQLVVQAEWLPDANWAIAKPPITTATTSSTTTRPPAISAGASFPWPVAYCARGARAYWKAGGGPGGGGAYACCASTGVPQRPQNPTPGAS